MLEKIFFSIAGRERNDEIDSILLEFIDSKYITDSNTKKLLKKCYDTGQYGSYPSESSYNGIIKKGEVVDTIPELKVLRDEILEKSRYNYIRNNLNDIFNKTSKPSELSKMLGDFLGDDEHENSTYDFSSYKQVLYTELQKQAKINGFKSGISKLDEVTNGFQPGTVATIAAFTGQGKSTLLNSILYKNVLEGKKVVLFSLELPVEQVWMYFEARYMYENVNQDYTTQQFIQRTIDDSKELEEISKKEVSFKEKFTNLMIVDENVLSKAIISDFKKISDMYAVIEDIMGGIDIVAYDHIGQIDRIYPDMGNIAVRNITSATKTYYNKQNIHPCTIMCVQVNREGNKLARQNDGKYSLQAIGDLNEVERSSAYCVFLYTDDYLKCQQFTKVSLLKHRFGSVIPSPFQTRFIPSCITVGEDSFEESMGSGGISNKYIEDMKEQKQEFDFDEYHFDTMPKIMDAGNSNDSSVSDIAYEFSDNYNKYGNINADSNTDPLDTVTYKSMYGNDDSFPF